MFCHDELFVPQVLEDGLQKGTHLLCAGFPLLFAHPKLFVEGKLLFSCSLEFLDRNKVVSCQQPCL